MGKNKQKILSKIVNDPQCRWCIELNKKKRHDVSKCGANQSKYNTSMLLGNFELYSELTHKEIQNRKKILKDVERAHMFRDMVIIQINR